MAEATSTKTKSVSAEGPRGRDGQHRVRRHGGLDAGDRPASAERGAAADPQVAARRELDPLQHELLEERIKIQNEVAKQERDEEVAELEVPPGAGGQVPHRPA